jgi:uncharacterized protein (TIGR02147 family)
MYRKMALHLNLSSVTISQIFRGSRDLSLDLALLLADFWGLSEIQKKYFLLMVQKDRASHHQFAEYCHSQMSILQKEMEEVGHRAPKSKNISEQAKAQFYSHWKYSAIRLLTDIEGRGMPSLIARELGLPLHDVKHVLEFLLQHTLVKEISPQNFRIGHQATHLASTSPWLRQHHRNWRTKALEGLEDLSRNELSYTAPMAISEESLYEIRELLLESIEKIIPMIKNSKSETLACLNLDLFKITKRR